MGNFINTEIKDTVSSLVLGFKERMKNPYWLYSDKPPTIVTYYAINYEKSMLDKGTALEYDRLEEHSPLKFNKIQDFFLYGVEKINVNLQDGEYGLESDPVEGEAIILPNTIEPTPGDYFSIDYTSETLLFRVNSVNMDTLEDGANFWKIEYRLDQWEEGKIDGQIVESYNMIIDNANTKFKSIIKTSDYKLIESLEVFVDRLKEYYIDLFYEDRVQTFIFYLAESRMYDPCMIEFLIRNNILKRKRNFLHVTHQLEMNKTFSLEYDCSLFRSLEVKDKNIGDRIFSIAEAIDQVNSTFNCRSEKYYEIKYLRQKNDNINAETIINLNPAFAEAVKNKQLFNPGDPKCRYNIIIRYFYNMDFDPKDLELIEHLPYQNNIELFYMMPFYIFVIEDYIKRLLITSR